VLENTQVLITFCKIYAIGIPLLYSDGCPIYTIEKENGKEKNKERNKNEWPHEKFMFPKYKVDNTFFPDNW